MSELWTKDTCPNCGVGNWVYCGRPDDCSSSGGDFDGLECHACKHRWLIMDRSDLECKYGYMEDSDDKVRPLEDHFVYEKGKAVP